MASNRTSGTKKSTNPKTTAYNEPKQKTNTTGVARAHRDDTPEAGMQRDRASKTHPTREPGSRRKQ